MKIDNKRRIRIKWRRSMHVWRPRMDGGVTSGSRRLICREIVFNIAFGTERAIVDMFENL